MSTRRSRTGCMTCRKRKLKCDETRPVCGQCTKANRECVPSVGLVFRNQQNPSLNNAESSNGGSGLNSFYSYKNTFSKDAVWVPIPHAVSFVHVIDPYADEQSGTVQGASHAIDPTAAYQNIASHSLEALSTAATANPPSYPQQNSYMDQAGNYAPYNSTQSGYGPPRHELIGGANATAHQHNNNISFLLNPSVIDPNLEASVQQDQEQPRGVSSSSSPRVERRETKDESDQQVAFLLRNFAAEAPAQ